ncbi:TIGR02186 family protein [Amphiplicatus metriothermophilus]|uniref:Transmembrane protein (Alph_Pro_TM) n=1 Tax=Amphiplicatus metriothermophilus TaxID=1519374 RepID=A0A239PZC0_9PROT|nr:TIGR02186 family protein [Amphiplicatus metriothermophilus]MBB5518277.1 uncharacterized protein (TIGR02186 family) [Amphiplicatus metriothermophilus]SNT75520.1 conserved hypothetical protein [Amphiplicatus metriothermophilus]
MRTGGLICALLTLLAADAACANDIAVALTDSVVEVDAGFAGARIVLFGAVEGLAAPANEASPYDIVAVLRGPDADFRIRPMERRGLIWTRGPGIRVEGAPGFYIVAATQPVEDFAPPDLRRALEIGAAHLDIAARLDASDGRAREVLARHGAQALTEAFLEAGRETGRFREIAGAVAFHKGPLFSIAIDLPPTTPIGEYEARVYLIRDGEAIAQDSAALSVDKVGIERRIYDLAHQRPIAYGLFCVAMSLGAGWLAAAAFRK